MSSISNSSISIESAALAAPAYAGFHRENPRLTDYQDSENGFSNKPGASQKNIYIRLRSLVVRTSDFSMIKRVLKGISHTGVLFSGYFDRALGGVAQHGRAQVSGSWCPQFDPGPLYYEWRYENDISACLRTSGNPGYSRFRITWRFESSSPH